MPGLYYLSGKLILYIVNVLRVCNTAQILRLGEAGSTENHGDLDVNGHVCINSHRHSDVGWLSVSNTSSPSFFLRGALLRASGHDGSGAGPCATEADGEEGNGQSSWGAGLCAQHHAKASLAAKGPATGRGRGGAGAVPVRPTGPASPHAGARGEGRRGIAAESRRLLPCAAENRRVWKEMAPVAPPLLAAGLGGPAGSGDAPRTAGRERGAKAQAVPGERTPKQVRWAFLSRFLSVRSCLTLFPTAAGAFGCSSKNMPA